MNDVSSDSSSDSSGDQVEEAVPDGFNPLPTGLGFTDAVQPVYCKIEGDSVSIGLVVQAHHGNTMGICHGGVLMVLSDVTAAFGVNHARGESGGSPTVNLNIDFITAARRGEWIQADAQVTNLKKRFGFCSGAIYSKRGMVARFSGTFYFPDHGGMYKDGKSKNSVAAKVAP